MFETLPDLPVAVNRRRTSSAIYTAMDQAAWPDNVPPLTEAAAIKAAKKLYRHFCFEQPYQDMHGMSRAAYFRSQRRTPPPITIKVKVTSGRRYNDLRHGTIYVNPPRGWHALVHELSHDFHRKLRPRDPGHGDNHRALERAMIEYVVTKLL
jgi:hypothetical protein